MKATFKVNLMVYPGSETVAVEQHFEGSSRQSYSGEKVYEGFTLEFDVPAEIEAEVEAEVERIKAEAQAKVLPATVVDRR